MITKIKVKDSDYTIYSEIQVEASNAQQRLEEGCLPDDIEDSERFKFYQDSILLLIEANYKMYIFSQYLKKEYGLVNGLRIDEQRNLWGCTADKEWTVDE